MNREMESHGSVSDLILSLKHGDSEAERAIWARYFQKLCAVARLKFGTHPRAIADEEDIALGVFEILYRGVKQDQFNKLNSRTDLWRLLVLIASNKVSDQIRRELATKRGGGRSPVALLEEAIPDSPGPEDVVALQETCRLLFDRLEDPTLCRIAQLRLEGHSKREVGDFVGVSVRTIERKLNLIETIWVSLTET